MSKAEEFISEHTKHCSNQYDFPEYFENGIKRLKEYKPWLSPDHAKRAVEIEREEMIKKVCNFITEKLFFKDNMLYTNIKSKIIEDIKQEMKDE